MKDTHNIPIGVWSFLLCILYTRYYHCYGIYIYINMYNVTNPGLIITDKYYHDENYSV